MLNFGLRKAHLPVEPVMPKPLDILAEHFEAPLRLSADQPSTVILIAAKASSALRDMREHLSCASARLQIDQHAD